MHPKNKNPNTSQLLEEAYKKIHNLTTKLNDFDRPVYGLRAKLERELESSKIINDQLLKTCQYYQGLNSQLLLDRQRLHSLFELFGVLTDKWDLLEYKIRNMKHMSEYLPILHTSEEWCKLTGITILDPDGWDRSNYLTSWNELITREEFDKRASKSTIFNMPTQRFPIIKDMD